VVASAYTTVYLVACAAAFTLFYGLPLALAPLAWARRLGWQTRDDALTVYLGRCLGCVITAVCVAAMRVAADPAGRPMLLELLAVAFFLMIVVHLHGWLRGTQPPLETAELPGFLALTALALWLRFG
jgi:hypothetical protein